MAEERFHERCTAAMQRYNRKTSAIMEAALLNAAAANEILQSACDCASELSNIRSCPPTSSTHLHTSDGHNMTTIRASTEYKKYGLLAGTTQQSHGLGGTDMPQQQQQHQEHRRKPFSSIQDPAPEKKTTPIHNKTIRGKNGEMKAGCVQPQQQQQQCHETSGYGDNHHDGNQKTQDDDKNDHHRHAGNVLMHCERHLLGLDHDDDDGGEEHVHAVPTSECIRGTGVRIRKSQVQEISITSKLPPHTWTTTPERACSAHTRLGSAGQQLDKKDSDSIMHSSFLQSQMKGSVSESAFHISVQPTQEAAAAARHEAYPAIQRVLDAKEFAFHISEQPTQEAAAAARHEAYPAIQRVLDAKAKRLGAHLANKRVCDYDNKRTATAGLEPVTDSLPRLDLNLETQNIQATCLLAVAMRRPAREAYVRLWQVCVHTCVCINMCMYV
jgi:hypothetical protein